MANYDNIKDHGFDNRTARERRELAKIAGKASGLARRRKADFQKTLNKLLTAKIESPEWEPLLAKLEIDATLESAMLMSMIKAALGGDVKAAYFVAQYAGQSDKTVADEKEQKIRTERAKNARDQEVCGDDIGENENIKSFLAAMKISETEAETLFQEISDEETEETSEI